jgi:hypothetical protein
MSSTTGISTLIQIVPRRTAEPNGVGDYASALAGALRSYDVNTVFVSGTPSVQATMLQDQWNTVFLPTRETRCLADTLQRVTAETKASAVLLHFSGYGYQKRGVPLWLAQGIGKWSRRAGHVPLLTVFHELYATSRPWNSAFWLSPLQKRIARGILKLSSEALTPTKVYRDRLLNWNSGIPIRCMPVFSGVGEPGCGSPPGARAATAVVFGLAGVEDRVFGLYRPDVERILRTMRIEKLIDIGPRHFSMPSTLAGVPVISKGPLPPLAVSELFRQARFGFIAYPFDVLGKSGVFAAYAAHGILPIVLAERRIAFDGLEAGRHFLDGLLGSGANADLDMMQRQLFDWYAAHSLHVQASFIQESIRRGAAAQLTSHSRSHH